MSDQATETRKFPIGSRVRCTAHYGTCLNPDKVYIVLGYNWGVDLWLDGETVSWNARRFELVPLKTNIPGLGELTLTPKREVERV